MSDRPPGASALFRLAIGKLESDELRVLRFEAHEGLSRLFQLDLELVSEDPAIDFDAVIGESAAFAIERGEEPRFFQGIVTHFEQGPIGGRFTRYTARVEPHVWRLTQRLDSRIFQALSVPEIIEQVLERAGVPSDTFEFRLQGAYEAVEYCVQYQESDWDFVSRLLEEQGIFYFFEHGEDEHCLVFGDASSVHAEIPGPARLPFRDASTASSGEEHLRSFRLRHSVRPGAVALRDFSFQKPKLNLDAGLKAERDEALERYEYPAGHRSSEAGSRLSRIRLEEQQATRCVATGRGDCHRLTPGMRFELSEHPREDVNRIWLLTEVEHRGHEPQSLEQEGGGGGEEREYDVEIRCIPHDVDFRPPRSTPLPCIRGTQSATVVGPSNEEIYTDEYGRVKLRFHWDRGDTADEDASCWVRVSQQWAGPGYGLYTLPRVGHEVVVAFFEGDPSQPHVIGRVFNADNAWPCGLPDEKTKSGIKTASTPDGEGFNEIRFEDAEGEEQLFLHAQKQLDLRVGEHRYETVGGDQHQVVEGDRFEHVKSERHLRADGDAFEEIGADQHVKVGGKQALEVAGSRSLKVGGDVAEVFEGGHSLEVAAQHFLSAAGVVVEATSSGLTLKCGDSAIVIDSSGITLKGSLVTVDSQLVKLASGPGSPAAQGSAASLVSPRAPGEAFDADEASPGAVAEAKARQAGTGEGKYGRASIAPHSRDGEEREDERSWIEIELVDEAGEPVPGERYEVVLPDGERVARGTLDERGFARVEGIPAGECRVTFPEIDREAWEPE